MTEVEDRLWTILAAIIATYDQQAPEHRRRLTHYNSFHGASFLEWDGDELPSVTQDDLDDLHSYGLIDLDFSGQGNYLVKPSGDGRTSLRTYQREKARLEQPQQAIDLSWAAVRPVLHAVVDLWTEAGAPVGGAVHMVQIAERLSRPVDDLATARAIEVLASNDWLDASYDDTDEVSAAPTMRGLAATRGWPGGDPEVAAERLLSALDDVAANAGDNETRGWAVRARETLMEVGTKTLAEVVSKSVGTAV